MTNPLGPRTLGRDRFFFERKEITSTTFNESADFALTLISKNSVLLINEGPGIIEYSFNGTTVHGELNSSIGTNAVSVNDPSIVKIWFKIKYGISASVTVQNDTTILHLNTSDTSSSNLYSNATIDAFGRSRVSSPVGLFDSKQLYDNQPLVWDTELTGGGDSVHSSDRASSTLSVFNTGDKVIRQSRIRTPYQPGKSLLIFSTFVMGESEDGVSKKVGYFDENNGIFFQNNGTVNSMVVRSSVSGTPQDDEATQDNWNIDKLDGTGLSGISLDTTKAQIFIVDVEWLGVGSVRCGFVINGIIYYVHKFDHANIIDSVYMSTPNLPIRYEIENISGTATERTLEQICSSISSEGGYENKGFSHAASRGISALANVNDDHLYPLISLRVKSGYIGTQIQPEFLDLLCTSSNANFYWELIINPSVNGADAASWQPVTNSAIEYDISRTLTNFVTGGYVLASGYGAQKVATIGTIINGNFILGSNIAGASDQLVLAVQKIGMGTDDFITSITWSEFI
jgi:hypothetical protein